MQADNVKETRSGYGASISLGDATLTQVVDIEAMPFSVFDIFPDASEDDVRNIGARLGPRYVDVAKRELQLSFYSTVVRIGGKTVLVDTCCGNDKERPARPGWHQRQGDYLARLAAAGVRPEAVDFVMCTHLHADHVGWNTRLDNGRWVPTFPNAEYVFAEAEYSYWEGRHRAAPPEAPILYGAFADSVLPIIDSGQALLVNDGDSPLTGVHLQVVPGHTPGMTLVHLDSASRQAVICGDVIHHPFQLALPQLSTRFCVDPAAARRNRLSLLSNVAGTPTIVVPGHFPAPVFGRIEAAGAGYVMVPS